ncbi:MAG: hypothetical protein PHO37_05815 [Kiritimatiellae bacterium]|nr:hypothetical protein [Kiritimatiellia bacterium]
MKKIFTALVVLALLGVYYWIEISKIELRDAGVMPTLDHLEANADGELWGLFYRVRATIIDGQSASFSIPAKLRALEGELISLEGAAAFRVEGARLLDEEHVALACFDLMPLLSMTYGCDTMPDVEMRWTIVVSLRESWILSREEMIDAKVRVRGRFRIDTSQPYNAAFFIDDALASLVGDQ